MHVIISKEKDFSSELRHCSVPSVGEALPAFRDSADRQPFPKRFHYICGVVGAVVIDDQYFA
jgi:hypothetical protein